MSLDGVPLRPAHSLTAAIRAGAALNPAAAAFMVGGRLVRHAQWWALVEATTVELHAAGVQEGERVGVSLGATPRHCAVLVALGRLGAISVPLRPGLPAADLDALATRFGLGRFLTDDPGLQTGVLPRLLLGAVPAAVTGDALSAARAAIRRLDGRDAQPEAAERPLRLALTSGTTGLPQGVLHTHGQMLERIERTLWGCDAASRLLPPLPHLTISFIFTLGTLMRGGCIVLPRNYDHPAVIEALSLHAVTHLLLSPAAALGLIPALPPGGPAFPHLRHLRIVGAQPSASLLDALRARCSPEVFVPYGLTELGVISLATPATLARDAACAGPLAADVEVQVLDDQGAVLPAGASGELRIRARPMPAGYEGDAEASARRFRDGWFHPGDRGRLDAAGWLTLEGRLDDVINLDGHKLMPATVETRLLQHPAVRDAAVFVLPRPGDGAAELCAALQLHPGPLPADFSAQLHALAGADAPAHYFVLRELPRTAAGKLARERLPDIARTLRARLAVQAT